VDKASTQEFQQRLSRVAELIAALESAPDATVREQVRELIQTLLDLHGTGLERVLTSAVTEIAQPAGVGIVLNESSIPINEDVKGACEILGLDPLYVANEGKLIAIVPPDDAAAALAAMRKHSLGKESAIIGDVTTEHPGFVVMKTRVGGMRVVDMLSGEQLPRIC
jgi:hydrogenase maturation factor